MNTVLNKENPQGAAVLRNIGKGVANTDFEVRSLDTMCVNRIKKATPMVVQLKIFFSGHHLWNSIRESRSYFLVPNSGNV